MDTQAYTQAFEALLPSLPVEQHAIRRALLARLLETGLPTRKIERFKYSDLTQWQAPSAVAAATALDSARWALPGTQTQVFINGHGNSVAALDRDVDDSAHAGLAALNASFATHGLNLHLADGEIAAEPLQALILTQPSGAGEMSHLRHHIRLGKNAQATVILREVGLGDAARLTTQTLRIELAEGARLTLLRTQAESLASEGWFGGHATLAANASLTLTQVDLGGALIRSDWDIDLNGAGAEAQVQNLFAPTQRSHIDNYLLINHRAPHCRSRQTVRGLAWDRARGYFTGKVMVLPGAQKTDSQQKIASLLLSDKAEINAKPALEIYADDVKCAHGATFGQLDEQALFYLRSRGVTEASARALLIYSFANEILQTLHFDALREPVTERLLSRIGDALDMELFA
ncbi:Fe-S cluster assembly protein SufD [Sinimarinibacterium sp. NLF-5-8]|uniref:Fe-S cluster assembly protein SufD n=1 Tax=Sinimarinibacterium sp. NLF-5-8 TaxID=2698684 RepID=UPI00137BA6BB|nr:Fe-S cluster assembly protein SufD [Sinimarinibacterium sp. NLF-5-8]QHS11354.1 Fe-S cluster assembly protein SufD [Sinimarinibacterium sp. NLF-5-8]